MCICLIATINNEYKLHLLDVHLEHHVPIPFPLFAAPLEVVHAVVRHVHKPDYEKGYKEARTFLESAHRAHHIQGYPRWTASQLFSCDLFELTHMLLHQNFCVVGKQG